MNKTERQICDALIELIQEKPLSKIKVTDVVAKAGVSRSTFYIYYQSIHDVLQAIEDDMLNHLICEDDIRMKNDPDIVMNNFSYLLDNLSSLEALLSENGDPSFDARLTNRSNRVFSNFDSKTDSKLTKNQLAMLNEFTKAGKIQVFRWWKQNRDYVSVQEVVDMFNKMTTAINEVVFSMK